MELKSLTIDFDLAIMNKAGCNSGSYESISKIPFNSTFTGLHVFSPAGRKELVGKILIRKTVWGREC